MRYASHAVLFAAAIALAASAWAQSVSPQAPIQQSPTTPMTAPSAPAPLSQAPATAPSDTLMRVDAQTVAGGQRTSQVVGSSVVKEANETVGKVDDLIVAPGDRAPVAVLSVGGFLGIGTRYVLVPYSAIEKRADQLVLRGATKDNLKALPEYNYRG